MRPITIDELDIKEHKRYAVDQKNLDTHYITDAATISAHFEIASISTLFPSQFELLFELQQRNRPWAFFLPPLKYHLQSNRFFSYCLLPSIKINDQEKREKEKEEEEEETDPILLKKIKQAIKGKRQTLADFEREKTTLISLVESIQHLDKILVQINTKKQQYQKG